mgnify:CR=1 FL=1
MVDRERIREKLRILQEEINKLDLIKEYDFDAYQKTPFVVDASLRNFQIAI